MNINLLTQSAKDVYIHIQNFMCTEKLLMVYINLHTTISLALKNSLYKQFHFTAYHGA